MKVQLYLRVRLPNGKRYFAKAAYAANGRIKPSYCIVHNQLEHHSEGVYHLRYVRGDKRVWESLGTDAYAAITAQFKKEKALAAKAAGVAVLEDDGADGAAGRDLTEAIIEYLSEVKAARAKNTYIAYKYTLGQFQPATVLVGIEATEREWSTKASRPGEEYIIPLLNQYRASWAIIRQWTGHDPAIAAREAYIERLQKLVWDAIYALQKAGLDDGEAARLRRVLERR